jgi:hypothetical protein
MPYITADLKSELDTNSLFVRLISHQPAVFFSQNKPATSNQPAVLFSQNKSAPAISHQPNEQAVSVSQRNQISQPWELGIGGLLHEK